MVKNGAIWKFSSAFVLGLLVGYKIMPPAVIGFFYVLIIIACVVYAAQNDLNKFFTYLPYAIYAEVFIRASVRTIPYLGMEYLYVTAFGILLIKHTKNKQPHSKAFYFLVGFAVLEIINGFFPARPLLLRAIFFNSLIFLFIFNPKSSIIKKKMLNNLESARNIRMKISSNHKGL